MPKSQRSKTDYPGVYFSVGKMSTDPKRTEKIYYIRYRTKEGKQVEEKAGRQYKDDMTAARASHLRAERIRGHLLSNEEKREQKRETERQKNNTWTLNKLWEEYTRQTLLKGIVQDRNRYNLYLKPIFGEREPKDLVPLDVDRLRLKMLKEKSPQTVKSTLSLIRRITNFGVRKRICQPLSFHIEMPKVDNIKTEDVTQEQLSRLLEAIEADTHHQAGNAMLMALYTGMRRSEIFRLKWDDLDFQRGFITLKNPKGGKDQQIPLNEGARALLNKIEKTDSPYVFPGREGNQRKDMHRELNRIRDAAGLPKDFRALHGLRHVFASMLASSGQVDLYALQRLLTHKSPQMTQRYAHLRDDALKKASGVVDNILGRLSPDLSNTRTVQERIS